MLRPATVLCLSVALTAVGCIPQKEADTSDDAAMLAAYTDCVHAAAGSQATSERRPNHYDYCFALATHTTDSLNALAASRSSAAPPPVTYSMPVAFDPSPPLRRAPIRCEIPVALTAKVGGQFTASCAGLPVGGRASVTLSGDSSGVGSDPKNPASPVWQLTASEHVSRSAPLDEGAAVSLRIPSVPVSADGVLNVQLGLSTCGAADAAKDALCSLTGGRIVIEETDPFSTVVNRNLSRRERMIRDRL